MTTIQVKGTIEYHNLGIGTWALRETEGVTYELLDAPAELHQEGQVVQVKGQLRPDVMSLAMIGPILQVLSYQRY